METVLLNEDNVLCDEWPGLIDTHCHLDLEPLSAHLADVLANAERAGVSHCVVPGVHPDGWERMAGLAGRYKQVFPAYGIHPMHAGLADDDRLSHLASIAAAGVAIGEIGLDPAYTIPLERQERAFRDQLRLAVSLGLPVLVHCRRAFQRTLRILQEEGAHHVGGLMHAYSGSSEMAREFIRLGFAISISGMVTRNNSLRLHRVVHELALEELVLETDAPDLTPQRYRGRPNQPAYLMETLQAVARIKGVDPLAAARSCRARSLAVIPGIQVG
ncbi:MAG: TatD family hydrolase [Desulfuromonadales bacterium]|nr:TatD family hydrolase [Desulfuromonadales bacterium]